MSLSSSRRFVAGVVPALVALVALAPPTAESGDRSASLMVVTDTVGATAANPSRGVAGLAGAVQLPLHEGLSASLGASYARGRTSSASGVPFDSASAAVLGLRAGLSETVNEHVTFSVGGSFSPTARSSVVVPLDGVTAGSIPLTSALVSVEGATRELQAALSLTPPDTGAVQHQIDLGLAYARIHNREQVLRFSDAAGPVDSIRTTVSCNTNGNTNGNGNGKGKNKNRQCERLDPLLPADPRTTEVDQLSLAAGYTLTLSDSTSFGLGVTRYSYPGTDPSSVAFFSVAMAGRTSILTSGHGKHETTSTITTPGTLLHAGTPLAAPAYELEAQVGRDFGGLHAGASLGYGRYYKLDGSDKWAGVDVTLGADRPWQLTAAADLGWSDDSDGASVGDARLQITVAHRFPQRRTHRRRR